ncbi:cobyrinic acid a,c-diamide synthase [Albimonas pacifica]|uniref:Hydrogenobyrinate a,c-diamide synthase n=1 Tax=Albimonas pacifica TaxID=1114924 RepID=A0A1I3L502_9RHOB|nr:cobyrinic acid a,c-diamide synthase [Albimonas pacifica]
MQHKTIALLPTLLLAAPASGSGKTLLTLGLLRAFRDRGLHVVGAKSGPDYIDPRFHQAACGRASSNLDAWAMAEGELRARAQGALGGALGGAGGDGPSARPLLIVEGAMGALDGAPPEGKGSAADLAAALGAPVVMVVDAGRMAGSAALAPAGLRALRPEIEIAGVILNRIGSPRHEAAARRALEGAGLACLGAMPRQEALALPSRHLGLVQAQEHPQLEAFVAAAGAAAAAHLDLDAIAQAARPLRAEPGDAAARLAPPGQRVAVARDAAFAFAYPHLMADWRAQGAELVPFSPLADEAPDAAADAVYLPGGYPELHAGRLAGASAFLGGLRAAAARGATVYGECGGFMALGEALVDADGAAHPMAGLLPVTTSFAVRKMTLGYRRLAPRAGAPWAGALNGHEFHYATIVEEGPAERLFDATDAAGKALAPMGLRVGRVMGSYAHVIAPG